jgi:hypothetical protein
MIKALSDISRTNQLKITSSAEEVAEKLYLYLFKLNKGIGWFDAKSLDFGKSEDPQSDFYQRRHRAIKREIKKRLLEYGKELNERDIQYFSDGKNSIFFLTPNKTDSSWKQQFKEWWNQGKILNLIFKFYLLSEKLPFSETYNGLEKLLLLHSSKPKHKNALEVWGQEMSLNYNSYKILTLKLSRKCFLFSEKAEYHTFDGDELGEMFVYHDKQYYVTKKLDGRSTNSIQFMTFKNDESFEEFRKTRLYHYQNLITQLEKFLGVCGIVYERLSFQADHYIENSFIKNIKSVKKLEIINNTGKDLTDEDKQFLENFLQHEGVFSLSFYCSGKTISSYEFIEDEGIPCWKINENIPWQHVVLDKQKNYLVFNKILDEESETSIAYQQNNLWYPTAKIAEVENKSIVDFYTHLKRKICYVDTGEFISIQGMNVAEFRIIKDKRAKSRAVLNYSKDKLDEGLLRQDIQAFTHRGLLEIEESIVYYLMKQHNRQQLKNFCKRHKIKFSPEFQKVLIELGIKSWIRENLEKEYIPFHIACPSLPQQEFFSIYVRHPKKQTEKLVAVEFLYKDGNLSIKNR